MAQYTHMLYYTPCTTPDLFNEMAKGESTRELLMNPYVRVRKVNLLFMCERNALYLAKMKSNKKASTEIFPNSTS